MAENSRLMQTFRHIESGETIHAFQPPNVYVWERVEMNIMTGDWEVLDLAVPRRDDEEETRAPQVKGLPTHWRNQHTGYVVLQHTRPATPGWERVEMDTLTGKWVALVEVFPDPEKAGRALEADTEHMKWWNNLRPAAQATFLGSVRGEPPVTPIKGYRQLSALELELTNKVKAHAEETHKLIEELETYAKDRAEVRFKDGPPLTPFLDPRWLSIGRTNLQQGFMALVRAITKPETF